MRIRTIKPEFFMHDGLYELEVETGLPIRISFAGLWCAADREGRFKWNPRRLGASILPYDQVDFSRVLHACLTRGYIRQYRVNDAWFGVIPTFIKHQIINTRERPSIIPDISQADEIIELDACPTRAPRVPHACPTYMEGKGRERKGGTHEMQPAAVAASSAVADGSLIQKKSSSKNGKAPAAEPPPDPLAPYPDLATFYPRLLDLIQTHHPTAKTIPDPDDPRTLKWRSELAAAVRLDHHAETDVIDALTWLFTEYEPHGDFDWRDQVHAIPPLRTRKSADSPSKLERIISEWKRSTELSPAYYTNSARESKLNAAQAAGRPIPGLRPADFPAGPAKTVAEMAEDDLPF